MGGDKDGGRRKVEGGEQREREIITVRYKDGAGCRKINLCLHPLLIHHLLSAATCSSVPLCFPFCRSAEGSVDDNRLG